MSDLRDAILRHVSDAAYKPVKPAVIAKRLGLEPDEAPAVRKEVKRLIREKLLKWGPSHQVMSTTPLSVPREAKEESKKIVTVNLDEGPDADAGSDASASQAERDSLGKPQKRRQGEHVVGVYRRTNSGFGFVRPEGTPASDGRDADVFIPENAAGDAANGDTVRIRLGKLGRQGKPEGKVVDVVERATNKFVGGYFERDGMGLVEVDGKVFANPVYVGDPGAKGVQSDDKVVIEMVRFPSHVRDGEGVILEVLGQRGQPGVDTLSIIHEYNLPGPFAEDALENAREEAKRFEAELEANGWLGSERNDDTAAEPSGASRGRIQAEAATAELPPYGDRAPARSDLTAETIVTIDPATARDFDDAISLVRLQNGHWLLGVHIADVSHFVQPKSALDREARDRATSVYLPDRVIPMLPEIISNNLASLQPDRVRFAITAQIEFTEDGLRVGADVFKSAIKSCRRFTYEEVDDYLRAKGLAEPPKRHAAADKKLGKKKHAPADDRAAPPLDGEGTGAGNAPAQLNLVPEVDALLERMFTLAMTLRERRFRRGALELSMPELEIDLDKEGRVAGAHVEESTESHQVIEEFMLAANEAVAQKLEDAGLLFLRRVHGAPDPRKLRSLTNFVKELGFDVDGLESRFALQRLLDEARGDPRQHAVNFALLRSMQRAIYSPEEEGHYALSSECYCHFTSPIRRYPDLTIHRLVETLAAGKKPTQDLNALYLLGDHCSEREQRATEAERELNKVKLLNFLVDKIGMELDGVVTGVESFGMFATGTELPAEGFIHISGLTDDYYKFDRAGHVIHGFRSGNSYRLGDPVRVAVAAVDVDRRELDFRLLGRLGPPSPKRRPGPRGDGSRKPDKPSKGRKKPGKDKSRGKKRRK
ncbi:MAG: RNB domain-containing ribonuclease [Pirellulales bacterium]|nr:RNB domain-containing ribonuclease [Pirellulales bacterium]